MTRSTRGQRLYDWWSDHQRLFGVASALVFAGRERAFRAGAVDALSLAPGQRVLDVGCGPGVNVPALADGVAPGGSVVGVDYSAGMVRTARDRLRDGRLDGAATTVGDASGGRGPGDSSSGREPDVTAGFVRADASRLPFVDGTFDAAYATLSMTAMADAAAVVRAVYRALRPGGRFVVFDTRPFQSGPLRLLNPLIVPVSVRATDWRPDADVVGALDETFDAVDVAAYSAGSVYVARAVKRA